MARTGAPTWAKHIVTACRLSHSTRFQSGATALLGEDAVPILEAWFVFCALFEAFLGSDDFPLQIDATGPAGPGDESVPE